MFADVQASLIRDGTEFFVDGTFKSCCPLFDQLYTLHVDLGSTEQSTVVVPAAFALLPDRKESTYRSLFQLIRQCVPQFSPKKIHIDYEKAAINAIKEMFPETTIKGCNFHFNQALWRKVQELGLATLYRDNEDIRNHIRMCAALAYLPEETLPDAWLIIMESAPNEPLLAKFNDYFVDQWLDNDLLWIVCQERHRTTNTVEGWHNRLNRRIGKAHPNIYELLKVIEEEIKCSRVAEKQASLHMRTPKRAKKCIDRDHQINFFVEDLIKGKRDLRSSLESLKHIVTFM